MLCMTVYGLHRTVLPMDGSYFMHAHLHDLMAMPILLGWIDLIMDHGSPAARFYGRTRFSVALTLIGAFVWEIVVPMIDPTSVPDPVDALCYVAGAIAYITLRRRITMGIAARTPVHSRVATGPMRYHR
jgi:hypothetical protein